MFSQSHIILIETNVMMDRREERIVEEERTRMTMTSVSSYSRKMVKSTLKWQRCSGMDDWKPSASMARNGWPILEGRWGKRWVVFFFFLWGGMEGNWVWIGVDQSRRHCSLIFARFPRRQSRCHRQIHFRWSPQPYVHRSYPPPLPLNLIDAIVRLVKAYGELPENAKINETDTFGDEDGECTFEFGDEGEVDIDDI